MSPPTTIDYFTLAEKARQHIKILSQIIGARPAGSANERQALEYIDSFLHQLGYESERQPIAYAAYPPLAFPYVLSAFLILFSGWTVRVIPWAIIWLPLWMMILPQATREWIRRRKPTQPSQNLFAYKKGKVSSIPKIILSAHIDSAPALPFRNPLYLKMYSRGMDLIQRVAWMVAALALLELIRFPAGDIVIIPVALLASLVGLALLMTQWLSFRQLIKYKDENVTQIYTPGANDNASGVGILLALAEALAQRDDNLGLALLFTSAEETGLHGARAFCANHEKWRHNTSIICLDMVGKGENLFYVQKEGVFNPIYTSQSLNQILLEANPHLKAVWYTLRSGDFAEFCRAGFQATSLQSGGANLSDWSYHSIYDTEDKIETPTLKMVLETLGKILENSQISYDI
ncbi:MAG: M20/M25/M40 family metallo-hydrolase [Anaerolineales bacterium]